MSNSKFRNRNYAVREFNIRAGEKVLSKHRFRYDLRQWHIIEIREDAQGNKFAKLPASLLKEIEKFGKKHPDYKNNKATLVQVAQAYDKRIRDYVDNIMITLYGDISGGNVSVVKHEENLDDLEQASVENDHLSNIESVNIENTVAEVVAT